MAPSGRELSAARWGGFERGGVVVVDSGTEPNRGDAMWVLYARLCWLLVGG